jgi:hypothetical protein
MSRVQDNPSADDLLIEKLRTRAYDPAWRFDEAPVPAEWVVHQYGRDHVDLAGDRIRGFDSNGMIYFRAGSAEAVEYYQSAPRAPLFPPVTAAEVEDAERAVGLRFPELLRRLYSEVANGGFGPQAGGFACLTDGNRDSEGIVWPSAVRIYQRSHKNGVLPASWIELTPGGCTMYWYVSLTEADNPVLLYDSDGWDDGEQPEDGVTHVTSSLRRWLWTWAEGGNVWDEVLRSS